MTCQKTKLPFKIENNVLIGEECSSEYDCTNIGEYILNAFKTKPDFIGQIDALTGKQTTFKQMRERSVKCALWLKKQGVNAGDVIVLCTRNLLEAYIPFLASLYIGALMNPWNEFTGRNSMEHFLKLTSPKIIFINGDKATMALEASMKLQVFPKIVVYDEVEGFESLELILDGHFDKTEIDGFSCTLKRNMQDTALLMLSSGTTGLPKAVEISQMLFTTPASQQTSIKTPGSVGMWFGTLSWFTSALLTVDTILSYSIAIKFAGFDSEKVCRVIEKYKVNWMVVEFNMCNHLLNSGALTKYDISSLRQITFGGSAIKLELHENIVKALPDVSLTSAYGMTETGLISCQRDTGKIGSSGYVCKNARIIIADLDTGKPLRPNMRGEICVKCPSIMNGYYKNPESTKDVFDEDGWFHTGDVGYYDEDGDIFVVDRIKELIKFRGYHVSPGEIETLLQSHPSVYNNAVISLPHPFDGQHPIAFVQKISGKEVTEEELEQLVAKNVDDHKKLRGGVVFLKDMPHTSSGKIDRKELRNMVKIYAKE